VVATAGATVAPQATLVPTAVPQATLAPLAIDLALSVGYTPFFTIQGGMSGGAPVSRDVVLQNSSSDMVAYLSTSLTGPSQPTPAPTSTPVPATALWTDTTNGLRTKVTLTSGTGASQVTSTRYDGPLNFSNVLLGTLIRGEIYVMNISVYLPEGVPNTLQATSQSASFVFTLIQ
jgi:hypothetical protein